MRDRADPQRHTPVTLQPPPPPFLVDGGFVHGEIGEQGVLTVMFAQSTRGLTASWWTVEWCRAKLVNKGVLTLMFEPSTSYLNASWWMVDTCMARDASEQGAPPGLLSRLR